MEVNRGLISGQDLRQKEMSQNEPRISCNFHITTAKIYTRKIMIKTYEGNGRIQ